MTDITHFENSPLDVQKLPFPGKTPDLEKSLQDTLAGLNNSIEEFC